MQNIMIKVPFNKPSITELETEYALKALNNDKICGDGEYTILVNKFFEDKFSINKTLLTTSCTHALEMAMMLSDVGMGDEVILPSYTFVSTANPILLCGAKPVFVDIDPLTLNIDPKEIQKNITSRTKVIIVVHYAGVSCDMDEINKIAKEHGVLLIEDAAQGVNAQYKGQYLGTIGHFGAYSFHETKNYVSGEGGALLINCENDIYNLKAEVIREKGTNRSSFFRGEVDKYTWQDVGSSYLPSDILSAILYAQLLRLDEIQAKRLSLYNRYNNDLEALETKGILRRPIVPEYAKHNAHMYYIILQTNELRNHLMTELKKRGIVAVFHYIPLHSSPVGLRLGYKNGDLPITEDLSSRLLRLPMYADLNDDNYNYVLDSIYEILDQER